MKNELAKEFVYYDELENTEKVITVKLVKHSNGNTGLYGVDQNNDFFSAFTLQATDELQSTDIIQLDNDEDQEYIEDELLEMGIIEKEKLNDTCWLYPIYRLTRAAQNELEKDYDLALQ